MVAAFTQRPGQPVVDAADHESEARPARVGGQEAEGRPALEHRVLGRPEAADLEEVVHDPDGVEAGVVGGARDAGEGRPDRRRAAGVVEAVQLEADLHGRGLLAGECSGSAAERTPAGVRPPAPAPRRPAYRKRSTSGGIRTSRPDAAVARRRRCAAHEGGRPARRLAEDELRGRGDLVGDGADRGGHRPAVGVGRAPEVLERPEAGDADREVGDPEAPRPPEAVRDDHARRHAEARRQPGADPPRGGVGVLGQEQHDLAAAGPTLLASTPALARTKPWRVSAMITPFAIRTTRTASRRTTSTWRGSRFQRAAKATASGRGSIVGEVDERALGLGDHLLGDDDDVVGAERQGTRRRRDGVGHEGRAGRRRGGPRGARRAAGRGATSSGRVGSAGRPAPVARTAHGSSARRPPSPAASAARRSSGVSRSRLERPGDLEVGGARGAGRRRHGPPASRRRSGTRSRPAARRGGRSSRCRRGR